MEKILAIIPTRAGSKGVPSKNIIKVGGKSLVAWTIEAALRSKYINHIIVSSDDQKVLDIAETYGVETIKRPKGISEKSSYPPRPVILHTLNYLKKKKNYKPDIIVYLQSTSPLRTYQDIDKAIKTMFAKKAGGVMSVSEINRKYFWSLFLGKDGFLKKINEKFGLIIRQKLPVLYIPNGAMYIMKRNFFMETKALFTKKSVPYVMSLEKSIDIDTPEDLSMARKVFKKRSKNKK
ncbi:MAG: acylneuraminate cytidylyltransferase family protein [Patescibacteria group bacterium]